MEYQVATRVDFHLFGAFEAKLDKPGIRPGRHHEIVFQLTLIAIVDEVDARIHVTIFDLGIGGNVRAPLIRVITYEVVHLRRQLILSRYLRFLVGPDEPHAQGVSTLRMVRG